MEEEKQTIEEQEPIQDKKKKYKWLQWVILIFILIVYSAVGIPGMIYARKKAVLSSCSGNLRNLGIIITNYSTDQKGHYPQNLEVLTEQGYIKELPVCPLSGESYIYEIHGWDDDSFTVRCPNPTKHVGTVGPRNTKQSLYYKSTRGVKDIDG